MQPEPTNASNTASISSSISHDTPPPSQHGLRGNDTAALSDFASTERVGADTSGAATALVEHDTRSNAHLVPTTIRRLSPSHTPSPPRNRIDEYEKAPLASPRKKRGGPSFEVIQTSRNPGDKRSPIQELPNEILIHALAELSPSDLTSISLVCRRFYALVTTPHAWRSAFSRFFPGPDSISMLDMADDDDEHEFVQSERRAFTRLTAFASWRSEYILRTRLIRSLARGKPVQAIASPASARSGQSHTAVPITTYNSLLYTTVNHLHATFGNGSLNKRLPRFIHGADDVGTASSSDPGVAKTDSWGQGDPNSFLQFADRFLGDAQYGLGSGDIVGVPNVMDVSQPYGMVHGEGMPGGFVYYRSTEEMRGRFLAFSRSIPAHELGIPSVSSLDEAMCCVWIAKSASIPSMTDGLIGILSGSSSGVLAAYSLGAQNGRDHRFGRGELTARWVLSPGVPLIAIAVDDQYSLSRRAQNRIWAVVLNALGEVFYLTKFPTRSNVERYTKLDELAQDRLSWLTGRSVYWSIAEPSRRLARPNPYGDSGIDGSYSPRSSWNGMCLSKEQIRSETREVESFISMKPRDFRRACLGWDMERRLEVDFAGDDGNNAGESVVVFESGSDEGSVGAITRYTRCRFRDKPDPLAGEVTPPLTDGSTQDGSDTKEPSMKSSSLFGSLASAWSLPTETSVECSLAPSLSRDDFDGSSSHRTMSEEWRRSRFAVLNMKLDITATAIDCSTYATMTGAEDPLLSFSARSAVPSPTSTPTPEAESPASPNDVPGQRARFVAAGTRTGSVIIWDVRAPVSKSAELINTIEPVRVIHTDSPEISCLALSSLYLVHGGNDGLVQAWDPLASHMQPIRTLNSRFSSRARRRLAQAQASPQGVGINLYAAGAICLDPDPTVLRGMVSLGTHLRYWSYSSSAANAYRSHKRRLRRSERGSNNGGERFTGVARGNLKDYIASEKYELDMEEKRQQQERDRLTSRFGTTLLGEDASEEELLAYAAMLSQESHTADAQRRQSDTRPTSSSRGNDRWSTDTVTPTEASPSSRTLSPKVDQGFDSSEVREAIRLSLAASASPVAPACDGGPSGSMGLSDFELALNLSLLEEEGSPVDIAGAEEEEDGDDFPALVGGGVSVVGGGAKGGRAKGKERGL
ncbi:hypothetical protein LTR66_010232 [Elasticomyces elasticus]|nr:hypothetical protein LTR66_010232 [Elasticomyces elasticus]